MGSRENKQETKDDTKTGQKSVGQDGLLLLADVSDIFYFCFCVGRRGNGGGVRSEKGWPFIWK